MSKTSFKRIRDFSSIENQQWDIIIIGGGITGATLFLEAVSRGFKALLLEKYDFGAATTAATSKLIHGGLRYLKNLEFGLVRESLRERRILEIIAPHLVYPIPFLVPTYSKSGNSFLTIAAGMVLYDLLSFDKANIEDPSRQIPSYRLLSKTSVLEEEPSVIGEDLTGGAVYYDCQTYSPERLCLAFVLTAIDHGGIALNYAQVEDIIVEDHTAKGVVVRDMQTQKTYTAHAQVIINATGPWADKIIQMAKIDHKAVLKRSKGIHIITPPIVHKYALVLRTPHDRHFFIIPWRNHALIGTTDTEYIGDVDDFHITRKDIEDFINEINHSLKQKISYNDVLYAYAGLRPLADTETDVYEASRKYEVIDHAKEHELRGLITITGGKYTTSRGLAESVIDKMFKVFDRQFVPSPTQRLPLVGGDIYNFDNFLKEKIEQYKFCSAKTVRHLVYSYGTDIDKVMEIASEDRFYKNHILDDIEDINAEILYSIYSEYAITVDDIVFRRTAIGEFGKLSTKILNSIADILGHAYNLSSQEKNKQIDFVLEKYDKFL